MGFFAIINVYTLRVTLNVAIVDMVNGTYVREFDAAHAPTVDVNDRTVSNITTNADRCDSTNGKNKTFHPVYVSSDMYMLFNG